MICKTCGKKFQDKKWDNKLTYCSPECRRNGEWKKKAVANLLFKSGNFTLEIRRKLSEAHKGEKSHLWKGGITSQNHLVRSSFEYKSWQQGVLKRDSFTCQICGKRGGELRANHIKKFADYPKLRFKPNNGITICRDCDIRWVLNKEEQWESYFNFNLMTRRTNLWQQ
jgi:5-methylcytosine-specific restriction endonuclease McrA